MPRAVRLPLRRKVREREDGGTTRRPQPLPPGKAARKVVDRRCCDDRRAAGCTLRGGTDVACTCLWRRRGRVTSRARNAMAKTIARVPSRTRPSTRMLRSISAPKAAVLRADLFLPQPRGGLDPAISTHPGDRVPHGRGVRAAWPGDVEGRAVADRREKDRRAEGERGDALRRERFGGDVPLIVQHHDERVVPRAVDERIRAGYDAF